MNQKSIIHLYSMWRGNHHSSLSTRHTMRNRPHQSATNSVPWPGVGTARQSPWGSCGINPSSPASWQQPPFPSLIPLLPASLGIRNIFLWYEDRWHGKANCREEEGDWQCVFMCVHLHSAWAYSLQTADHGDQRAPPDLSCLFAIFCYPFVSFPCKP